MIGQRLRQLRQARGWSLEALAAEIGGIVTKQSLGKYELGRARPSPVVVNRLAVAFGIKAAYLWSEPRIRVEFIAYRKGSRLSIRDQEAVESRVSKDLEDRIWLQERLGLTNGCDIPVRTALVGTPEDAEHAAEDLRERWNLGIDPIANVVNVLEDRHVHVIEIDGGDRFKSFDGISAVALNSDDHILGGAVVSSSAVPGERLRLNLCHELGHLVLKVQDEIDEEKAAFRFGAAFLAPASAIRREVGVKRSSVQLRELLLLKRQFGLSMQALLYRLRDLRVIGEAHYRQWCVDVNRLGWKRTEPAELPAERPQWLERNVLRAMTEGLLSEEDAKRLLRADPNVEQPLSLVERRAFMKLPLEERRRMLAEQAAAYAAEPDLGAEWPDLETGDILDD